MKLIHTKRVTDLFRPLKPRDQLCAVYLYADGHALASFERYVRDVDKRVSYYKQIDTLGIACRFEGRIVFSRYDGAAWLRAMIAAGCTSIIAYAPHIDRGTEFTKKAGVAVGYISAQTPFGEITEYDFPRFMSGNHTYQPDTVEAFDPERVEYGFNDSAIAQTLIARPMGPIQETR